TGAEEVNLIAHSMGNLGLIRALERITATSPSEKPFRKIILAAPDVDRRVFDQLAKAYSEVAHQTTMYVSSEDKALWSAGIVWGNPRAGYAQPPRLEPLVVSGIDTVDVTHMDLSWLGHSTFATARAVLTDLYQILWNDLPPDRRNLRLHQPPGDWQFP
ncbi:MAG TPA: alpha/beta hydrolase, partial [Gemmataceae bacterium]|nr:alpha/beta hydrolase [Gemmataceae bacterium]